MTRVGGYLRPVIARLSSRVPQRILSQVGGPGAAKKTYGCHWTVPTSTRALIFVHANYLTAEPSLVEAAYAPSVATANLVEPQGVDGSFDPDRLFRQVTWNGGQTTGEVPPTANPKVPSLIASDPMPFVPLPRLDGGDGALLFFRNFSSGPQSCDFYEGNLSNPCSIDYGFGGGWYNMNENSETFPHVRAGKYAGASGEGFGLMDLASPHAVIAVTDRPAISILQTGDSVNSGISADDGLLNPAVVAARVLTQQTGILAMSVNEAVSGDISANYIARAAAALKVMSFSVALIQCYSRNDQVMFGDTIETAMSAYNRAIIFAADCLDVGVIPVLETATPFASAIINSQSLNTFESVRSSVNVLVRQSGFAVLDYDRILGTHTDPNAYQAGLSEDGIHPNTHAMKSLGHEAAGVIAAALGL